MKLRSKAVLIPTILFLVCVVLNLLAWQSEGFCDGYLRTVFPALSTAGAFVTSFLPLPLGLLLTLLGIAVVLIGAPTALILHHKLPAHRPKIRKITLLTLTWIILFVTVTETFNCFILYHTTSRRDPNEAGASVEVLISCLTDTAAELERLSPSISRTGMGFAKYDGSEAQLDDEIRAAMRKYGETDDQFDGYYPNIKRLWLAELFRYVGTTGMYFPYAMEATISPQLSYIDTAFTGCHELSHLKGVMREDEANYIAYRACRDADSAFLQYSGAVNLYRYLRGSVLDLLNEAEAAGDTALADSLGGAIAVADGMAFDNALAYMDFFNYYRFAADTAEELAQEQDAYADTVLPPAATEVIEQVSDTVTDTSMKLNGVQSGIRSYGEMVDLVLRDYMNETGQE